MKYWFAIILLVSFPAHAGELGTATTISVTMEVVGDDVPDATGDIGYVSFDDLYATCKSGSQIGQCQEVIFQ